LNLLVTCARNLEIETKNEIGKILDEIDGQESEVLNVGMRGILMVNTNIEPSKIIDWVKDKVVEEPWLIRYCLRMIPIQSVTETDMSKITKDVIKLKDVIQQNDSYRITIEKRNTDMSSTEIITEIAKIFPNKVSLNQPDWIILIEILGDKTGISILKENEIFSLDKAKRASD
jgi:tRNA acetyltransferase TAN1